MSKKITAQLSEKSKKITLTTHEFNYLTSMDRIAKSFSHYMNALTSEYLRIVCVEKHGFKVGDNLEFNIDLADEGQELSVKILPPEEK